MASAVVRPLRDPECFCTAGGHPQTEYERRRLAFLEAATQADDTCPPVGLGLQGLAGLLLASGGEWTVCVVAAAPRRWTGAVDSRLTALLDAYRLIRRAASQTGAVVSRRAVEEDADASSLVCAGVNGATGAAGDD